MTDEFRDLSEAYLTGTASAREVAALDQQLRGDLESRKSFLRLALLHGQLTQIKVPSQPLHAEDLFTHTKPVVDRGWPAQGTRAAAWWAAVGTGIAATGLALVMIAGGLPGRGPSGGPGLVSADPQPANPAASSSLGVVKKAAFVVPANPLQPLEPGQPVTAGRLAISHGAVEVELKNRVILVMQGPCEIELIDELNGFLHHGSALVRVPKGMSGYRLDTATTEVLDLGTEFAVRTGPGLVTDVQVYDGAVITTDRLAAAPGSFPRRLKAGEARRFRPDSSFDGEPIPYSESRFIRSLPSEPGTAYPMFQARDEAARRFGRPQIESIRVARAARAPVIDGRLDEWPTAAGFRATLRGTPQEDEWAEGWMAYDERCLYIAARVGDPAPLQNHVDPAVDPAYGWQGGSVQVRLSTDRAMGWPADANAAAYYQIRRLEPTAADRDKAATPKLSHLTMWQHAPTGRACLTLNRGMDINTCVADPPGVEGRFRLGDDGRHYTLEYAIPWDVLGAAADPPRGGDVLAAHWQVHWADRSGQIWRDQLVEIRNLHEIRRIVSFERAAVWGRAEYE
jgi:hypothetical protein